MEPIKIVLIIAGPILGLLTFLLLKHYNSGLGGSLHSKRWFLRTGLLTFILSLASIILYFVVPNNNDKILGNQLNIKINEVEKSINGLNEYIKSQTVKINETNQKLDELKTEHKKLEPIVQIERKSVESLFVISEKRQAKQKWIDYGISFIMGIISTLVCNSIVKILQRKRQKE